MSTLEDTRGRRLGTQSLDALTHGARRRVLVALADASGSLSERALAAELAAAERDEGAESVDDEAVASARTRLYHAHLPTLEDAGLVSWDQSDETVAPAEHPLLDDARFEGLLRGDDEWDDVRSCVTDEDRLVVLDVLTSRTGSVARATLARELAARDASRSPSADAVHDAAVQLHHVHLPKLEDAGLVDYDTDEETVAYRKSETPSVGDLLVGA
ncbi:DUF7344 domain-containing protein [Halosimplex amylolyticum]|uniref:DUF7344 domain-containing protein n=1 Tax=Halosimplex amylolyticum TaxID=3396616 RepID=UPI003F542D5A